MVPLGIIYITVSLIIVLIISRIFKFRFRSGLLLLIIFICAPFAKEIFIKTLFIFYSIPTLNAIHETVDKPISVYWENNASNGFDDIKRKAKVNDYLDGYHLKLLVLNGIDGKYYVYRADENDYRRTLEIAPPKLRQVMVKRKEIQALKATIPKLELKNHPITINI